jgi:ABC-2 type transport system ATP-binding protein
MKQRLCLGRAMIHDPAVMILDEPAAGLDPRARIQLREMIHQLAADGKAILISSHILTELAEMCDMVGIIELGRLLAVGTVEQIMRQQQQHQSTVMEIDVLGGAGPIAPRLAERTDVRDLRIDGDRALFLFDGDAAAQADLLRDLVQAGIRVSAFGSRGQSLEEVFMQVTTGRVQ